MFLPLDIPLLQNSATNFLAMLPKMAGAWRTLIGFAPFCISMIECFHFFFNRHLQLTRLLLRWVFQEELICKSTVNEIFLEKNEHKHYSNELFGFFFFSIVR